MYKIFDIHTHTYPPAIAEKACVNLGKFYDFYVGGKGTYEDLCSTSKAFDAKGFLIFSVATNAHQVPKVNDFIAQTAQRSQSEGYQTVGFAGMHQDYPDFEAEIERCSALGLRGVKIHPDIQGVDIDDRRLLKLYAILQERSMPLYLHMGDERPQYRFSEAKKLRRVLEMFPSLTVVAAHFGGYTAWDEAERYLAGMPNVWYDTSSALWAMTTERAVHMIDVLGWQNIMFGTDYPVMTLADEYERFMKLDLDEKQRRAIFYDNAARFLSLDTDE